MRLTEKRQERAQRKHTDRRSEHLIVTLSVPRVAFGLQRDDVSAPARALSSRPPRRRQRPVWPRGPQPWR